MQSSFTITAAHPCLDGHFPQQPIVPGVVVLDHVIAALEQAGQHRVIAIPRCKFVRPLLPGTPCQIEWHNTTDSAVRFVCSSADGVLAQGICTLAPDASPP